MIVTLSKVSNGIAISTIDITFPITVTVVIKVRLIIDVVIVGTFVCVETSYRSFTLVANMRGILFGYLLAQRSLLLYVSTTFRRLLDSRRRWMLLVAVLPLTGMLILYQRLLLLVTVDQGRLASKH